MPGTTREAVSSGLIGAAISNSMVSLLHQYTGRGPTRARTTIGEDVIVCVMGATLTKGEKTLAQAGKSEIVLQSRRAFQEAFRADAITAVQEISHRRVVAFMSNNHIDPDLAVEVFVLEPVTDVLHNGHGLDGNGVDGRDSAEGPNLPYPPGEGD
ncbi:MAG: hypothetical protein QOD66_1321 [Solirubrobacteraceae bacterium]|jgi:uncharacterized protein YbcI|nr:hypothetical protein [Solirubrobacteraceae bacterium]